MAFSCHLWEIWVGGKGREERWLTEVLKVEGWLRTPAESCIHFNPVQGKSGKDCQAVKKQPSHRAEETEMEQGLKILPNMSKYLK